MADEMKTPPAGGPEAAPPAAAPPQPQAQEFPLDHSRLSEVYANFCRVARLPEELVLDFGLDARGGPGEPIKVTHRVIMNYYNAKRLLLHLHLAVQQHENLFGALEIDVNKRVRAAPRPPQSQAIRPS
jgi:hypothetical protein